MTSENERRVARDFSPEVFALFDEYVHHVIDRRQFLDRAAKLTTLGLSAEALLEALSPKFAQAQQVPPNDERLHTESVEFTPGTRGYLVRKHGGRGLPSVLVVHENRGLNPHIEDVARRLALEGFLVLAPDALSPLGGYPGDEDKARELFATLDKQKARGAFVSAARFLAHHPEGNGRVGVVGFCWGGGIAHYLATELPSLAASVPFYGPGPELDKVSRIKAPLLIHYAETDERINAGWPTYEKALREAGVRYQAFIYPGTQHGFHNDTTPRYDAKAAKLAWQRTVDFLRKHVASQGS